MLGMSGEEVINLNPRERIAYNKALNAERVKRFRDSKQEREEYKGHNRNHTHKYRAERKEKIPKSIWGTTKLTEQSNKHLKMLI